MEGSIDFVYNAPCKIDLTNHAHVGSVDDTCIIEYTENNNICHYKIKGYIQSVTVRHNDQSIGMVFGGRILLNVKRVVIINMNYLPGSNNYEILVEV